MRVQMLPHCLTDSGVDGAVGGEWRSGHTWGWTRCERRITRPLQRWRVEPRGASTWFGQIARHGFRIQRLNG